MSKREHPFPRRPKPDFEPSAEWINSKELQTIDLIVGSGRELLDAAPPGMTIFVDYICFDAETSFELESTWESPKEFEFPAGSLIDGWAEGLLGAKEGGRRILICPPDFAYGGLGFGHPKSGRTLVYLVDLAEVTA